MDESEQVSSFDRLEFYGWASGLGYWVYARMFSLPILLHSSPLLRRYNQLPDTSKSGQSRSSQSSFCQTITLSNADDFCLWAPTSYSTIGDAERYVMYESGARDTVDTRWGVAWGAFYEDRGLCTGFWGGCVCGVGVWEYVWSGYAVS